MKIYTISDEYLEVQFLDLGGRIISIRSVNCDNDLCLFYPTDTDSKGNTVIDEGYFENDSTYIGSIVGRVANRICDAKFSLNGKEYILEKNNGENCLHSASQSYSNRIFNVEASQSTAILRLEDKEGLFPGNVDIKIKYSVVGSSFVIQYSATPDKPTVINLTNHMYFAPNGNINDCTALFNAEYFTPVNSSLIPTGEVKSVENTVFDFTEERKIGEGLNYDDNQIAIAGGYDHNFVIKGEGLRTAASVYMPENDITLNVITTSPGFQFYTGNFLDAPFEKREGFCIETQYYPDTPNHSDFPSCVFTPEKPFRHKTIYNFAKGKIQS